MSSVSVSEADRTEPRDQRGLAVAYSIFLFVAVGRVGDLIPGLASVPLGKVAMGIALVLLAVKWKQLPKLPAVATGWTRNVLWLAALAVLTAPLSIWPGNSVVFLYRDLPVLVSVVIICCKLSGSWLQVRTVGKTLVISALALALSALVGFHGGRASAYAENYDTNDLAYVFVSILPLAIAFALNAKSRAGRIWYGGAAVAMVIASLLTASRGGLVGLLAVLAFLVLRPIKRPQARPTGTKTRSRIVASLLGVVCVAAVIWPNLPMETRTRLATVVALGSDYNSDTENLQGRGSVWRRNFLAAVDRPLGYGVSSFQMVDLRTGGQFKAPHNSYLQMMVELGFVGFLLFLRAYVIAWRMLQRARQTLLVAMPNGERDEMLIFARMLQAGLLGNAVAGFFLSMAYSILLWTLMATAIACASVVALTSEKLGHTPT
jgi:O-antigen ligase